MTVQMTPASEWKNCRRWFGLVSALVFPLLLLTLLFRGLQPTRAETLPFESLGIYGGSVYDAVVDPANERVHLITHFIPGIYYSDDQGDHWLIDEESPVGGAGSIALGPGGALYATIATGFHRSDDGGQTWVTLADASRVRYGFTINGSDVHAANPDLLAIAVSGDESRGGLVYTSQDGGAAWITATLTAPLGSNMVGVAFDPTRNGVLYAVNLSFWSPNAPSYIYRSADQGLTFSPVFTAPVGVQFTMIAVNALGTAYAGSSMGVFRSANGLDWDFTGVGGGMVVFGIHDPRTVYVDWAVSRDDGETWEPLGVGGFVAESAANPNLLFTAGRLGIQRSFDGGLTWEDCVTGIDTIEIQAVDSDPLDNQILYAATSHGAARSLDGGATWAFPLGDLAFTFHDLTADPHHSGAVYLGGSDGKVYHSVDFGETFTASQAAVGMGYTIWDILVDPADANRLYVATAEMPGAGAAYGSLYRSENAGVSWLTTSLEGAPVNALQAGRIPTATVVYAGVGDYWQATVAGGVQRSLDGGQSWQAAGLQDRVVNALAVHPSNGKVLYAGLGGGLGPLDEHFLYRTEDMGEHWEALPLLTCCPIETVSLDQNDSQILYAATLGQVYRSTDGGMNWELFHSSQRGEQFQAIYVPRVPPPGVRSLAASPSEEGVRLQWVAPNDPNFAGIHLRAMTGAFPTAHTVGISLTTQTGLPGASGVFTHTGLLLGETYYYSAFAFDRQGRYSLPAVISATVPGKGLFATNEAAAVKSAPVPGKVVYLATSRGLLRYSGDGWRYTLFLPHVYR